MFDALLSFLPCFKREKKLEDVAQYLNEGVETWTRSDDE